MRKNIKQNKYRCIEDMELDMTLLCKNAQIYNMEGSLVSGLSHESFYPNLPIT